MPRASVVTGLSVLTAILVGAAQARAHDGTGMVVDARGRIYFLDPARRRLWSVGPDGRLAAVLGNLHADLLVAGRAGELYTRHDYWDSRTQQARWVLWRVGADGRATAVLRSEPPRFVGARPLTVDAAGTPYFYRAGELLRLRADGTLGVVARGALGARITHAVATPRGDVVFSDGHRVRVARPDGTLAPLAGDSPPGFADGPAAAARFRDPLGIAVDAAGAVYVADAGNRRVRRISPSGTVVTVARPRWPWTPVAVATDAAGNVFVVERRGYEQSWTSVLGIGVMPRLLGGPRVRRLSPSGGARTLITVR